ncbi:DUF7504 family protein [Halomicrobium urmianum]|uniref:DUF7504 family protein n=1 Tax=Halomicrobium urmianum TaxID=1586233 RepID=UPI001CDA10F9|nr:hypothetical protein [Halomicrobium urmianum]
MKPGENVLVLSSEFGVDDEPVCLDLLTVEQPASEAMLAVTVTESPDDRIQLWHQHADAAPAAATLIDVDTSTRSAASRSTADEVHQLCETASVRTADSPADLTGLGVEITNALDELTAENEERQLVVCFKSLTPLLQYVSREELFKFVHLVTERFTQAGAVAHFHMDPTVHDEQTIATFLHLFDVVVELDDGEWTLKR